MEPTYVHPHWPAVGFLHCLVAIAGSLLAGLSAALGFGLVLVAAASFYLDNAGRWYLLRRAFFRRASQNVVSPPLPSSGSEPLADRPRVILTANYDAPLTGAAYNAWAIRAWSAIARILPARTSPQAVIFWAIALLLPPLGVRMAGVDADWVSALQLPQTFVLLVAAFFLGEIALSPAGPGANGNASGVAAAVAAAERLRAEPPASLDVTLLLAGAGETTRQGARSFIRSHRSELPRESTYVIDLAAAGRGDPRWVELEVPVIGQAPAPGLTELAAALGEASGREGLRLGPASAAGLAGAYGYPAIALTARERDGFVPLGHHTPADGLEAIDPAAIEAVAAFAVDLVRLLDRDVGRAAGSEPASA